MTYIKNKFHVEKISIKNLVSKYGSPLYCYSYKRLEQNIRYFKNNFKSFSPLVCFAVKSNSNLQILKNIKSFDLGADVVSKGELMKALKSGINKKKIVFSGVGKTPDELNYAIKTKILLINTESESEIHEIEKIAKKKKVKVDIGIRLNPDIDAETLKQISTGKEENKFGVDKKKFIYLVNKLKNSKYINLKCLSVHIGSQILNYKAYVRMLSVISNIIKKSNYKFEYVDLGGGIGIKYEQNYKSFEYKKYNQAIKKFIDKYKTKIIFEPGRSIIGNTAILASKVVYLKETKSKIFIILDAAMNDLMRPALYNARHRIIPEKKNKSLNKKKYEFVGPICETTDKFITYKKFQNLKQGDIVAICDVGAYGFSLSSNYNIRAKPAEILVDSKKTTLIRKREKLERLV